MQNKRFRPLTTMFPPDTLVVLVATALPASLFLLLLYYILLYKISILV